MTFGVAKALIVVNGVTASNGGFLLLAMSQTCLIQRGGVKGFVMDGRAGFCVYFQNTYRHQSPFLPTPCPPPDPRTDEAWERNIE